MNNSSRSFQILNNQIKIRHKTKRLCPDACVLLFYWCCCLFRYRHHVRYVVLWCEHQKFENWFLIFLMIHIFFFQMRINLRANRTWTAFLHGHEKNKCIHCQKERCHVILIKYIFFFFFLFIIRLFAVCICFVYVTVHIKSDHNQKKSEFKFN